MVDLVPGWKNYWATAMVEKFNHLISNKSDAKELILQLLDSIELGNSCVSLTDQHAQRLGKLVSTDVVKKAPFHFDGELLYLDQHFQLERELASHVRRIIDAKTPALDYSEFDHLLSDPHQKKSLQVVFHNNLNLITGGPGTGKTYTLARIIASLNKVCSNPRIAMAAPTGKAAQRMQEALYNAFTNESLIENGLITDELKSIVPITIHRLLGIGLNGRSTFGQNKKLPYDVVVIDEVSMLDLKVAAQLFGSIQDGTRVILLGDPNQLASVEVGSVLNDLKTSVLLKDSQVQLQKSIRFNSDAVIGQVAEYILGQNNKSTIELNDQTIVDTFKALMSGENAELIFIKSNKTRDYLTDLCLGYTSYMDEISKYTMGQTDHDSLMNVFDQYRILASTKHGDLGVKGINNFITNSIQQKFNLGGAEWYLGRPVMITQNNYKLGLSNGDIGICVNHRKNKGEFEVYFQSSNKWVSTSRLPKSIQTAYAMTIHKSQGSEFYKVAIVLDESEAALKVLSNELIYTGVTRGKKQLLLMCTELSLIKSVTGQTLRVSGLSKKLG